MRGLSTNNYIPLISLDVIGSNDEALRSPYFERIFPPLDFFLGADTDTLIHLCTSSENLRVGREAVADMILHHLRTLQGLDRDQLARGRVVGMRDNTMLLGVLGCFGIGIECFDCLLNICVGLDDMRVEACGWTVRAGRTAKNAIGGYSRCSGEDVENVRRSLSQNN
jgi:hypothetical protein